METILAKLDGSNDEAYINKAGEILRNGGLVAFPTETVYGLGANALDETAVEGIFKAKGRPQDNPLIVHITEFGELSKYACDIDGKTKLLLEHYWPGPLTVVLKRKPVIPAAVSAGLDTVAIRCPSNPYARAVIKAAGVPIAAPSANSSGRPSPTKASHVYEDLNGKIDMILDGGSCDIGVESTVVSLAFGSPVLLRPGAVTLEQLKGILGEVETDKAIFEKTDPKRKVSAPGMKYRHYAPKAKVIAVLGDDDKSVAYIKDKLCASDISTGVLCYNGEEKNYTAADKIIPYGDENNALSLAQNLFDALRTFDETDVKLIYARCPSADGVGLAVFNRIIKAAGFETVSL